MNDLDRVINEAVAQHDAPFLVAMVGNRDGATWSGAGGQRSPGQAASLDTVFRIFSMTKAVGSMAAMILMDRGKLSPGTTVESILPEFSQIKLLDGFDAKGPVLRAPRVKATVCTWPRTPRGFATSSGMPTWRAICRSPARLAFCRG